MMDWPRKSSSHAAKWIKESLAGFTLITNGQRIYSVFSHQTAKENKWARHMEIILHSESPMVRRNALIMHDLRR